MTIDWHLALAVLSGVLILCSIIPYVRGVLYGTTRPNAVTWFLWLFIQTIAIAAQLSEGASWSVVVVIVDGLTIFVVFVLSVIGYGYRAYSRFDILCGVFGVFAIILWQTTGDAIVALAFSIVADICAALPTISKAYRDPWSEHAIAWGITMLAALVGLAANERFDLANVLFPAYLAAVNGLIFFLAFFGQRRVKKSELPA